MFLLLKKCVLFLHLYLRMPSSKDNNGSYGLKPFVFSERFESEKYNEVIHTLIQAEQYILIIC